jgi:hypothetical protein
MKTGKIFYVKKPRTILLSKFTNKKLHDCVYKNTAYFASHLIFVYFWLVKSTMISYRDSGLVLGSVFLAPLRNQCFIAKLILVENL